MRHFSRKAGGGQLAAGDGWLAAFGETWWAAERALVAADALFTGNADADDAAVDEALQVALDTGDRTSLLMHGDYAGAVGDGMALAATYRIAPAEHLALEPIPPQRACRADEWKCGRRCRILTRRWPRRGWRRAR